MSHQQDISESLVKKRARDRRAQQNLRDKRVAHIESLEQHITTLDTELRDLRQTCYSLRRENEILRSRQEDIQQVVASWTYEQSRVLGADAADVSPISDRAERHPSFTGVHSNHDTNDAEHISPTQPIALQIPSENALVAVAPIISCRSLEELSLPPWYLTPIHFDGDLIFTDTFAQCFNRSDLVRAAPETPQPIDFLYGSRSNFLANVLHDTTRKWPCRDPERLAICWLMYPLLKWLLEPSETRYSRLRSFQTPVSEQLHHPHPYFVDFILWPQLRANLIRHEGTYDPQDVAGMLCCCLKVRWPWNKCILEPTDDGKFLVHADFFDAFNKLEGWGLTKEFMDRYPVLVEGLDRASIYYEVY